MTKRKSEYKRIAATIRRHDIPQKLIAELTGIWQPDLNAFLRGRDRVSPEREATIRQTVDDVVRVLQTCAYRPDLRRVADVKKLIVQANDKPAQLVLPLPEPSGVNPVVASETTSGTEVAVTL